MAIPKLKETHTGDTLAEEQEIIDGRAVERAVDEVGDRPAGDQGQSGGHEPIVPRGRTDQGVKDRGQGRPGQRPEDGTGQRQAEGDAGIAEKRELGPTGPA